MKRTTKRFLVELVVELDEPEEGVEAVSPDDCDLDSVSDALQFSTAAEALSSAFEATVGLYAVGQYFYFLNGHGVDLDEFLANQSFDDDEEGDEGPDGPTRDSLRNLYPGCSLTGGGAAAPLWTIECSLEEPCAFCGGRGYHGECFEAASLNHIPTSQQDARVFLEARSAKMGSTTE